MDKKVLYSCWKLIMLQKSKIEKIILIIKSIFQERKFKDYKRRT